MDQLRLLLAAAVAALALAPEAGAQLPDSVPAISVPRLQDDSLREGVLLDAAWRRYRANDFGAAAAGFARVAAVAPGALSRIEARLLAGQSLMEASRPAEAAEQFRLAGDTARLLSASLDARAADGGFDALGALLAARRSATLLWAPYLRDGRLVAPRDSAAGARDFIAVQSADFTRRLDSIGGLALDPALRALVWTAPSTTFADLRTAADSLAALDARVARAIALVDTVRAQRPGKIGAATAYTARVRTVADSFAVTDRQVAAFSDSVARRDSAIAQNIAQYRLTLQQKIAAVRLLAAQNRARIDSIAPDVTKLGGNAPAMIAFEQETSSAYVTVAGDAEGALDAGLTRLPVIFRRDTVRAKLAALRNSLVAARVSYDSALSAAVAAENGVTAAEDRRMADALAAQKEIETARDAAQSLVAGAAAAQLRSRAGVLRAGLARALEGADYGAAAAKFFGVLASDTSRAVAAGASAGRDGAIADLTAALAKYPKSAMRPRALMELGELLARKADADYAASQRANGSAEHPDYAAAMARFDEFLRDFPADGEADAAAYTLGSLAFLAQRYDESVKAFERVLPMEGSPYRAEAFFRHGDAQFEMALKQSGDARKGLLKQSAVSYDKALSLAPPQGDIYFLALYKLGWSDYVQADRQSSEEYRMAVDIFARLVREMDRLPKERQARLALRQEAVDYLAIAITQLGGAEEAMKYLGAIPDPATRVVVMRRVARALRDQGEFANAVIAYRGTLEQAPDEAGALETRQDLVDLYQNRMLEPARAQEARLQLVDGLAPESRWGAANPARAAEAAVAREKALRESGEYALAEARKSQRSASAVQAFAAGAALLTRYVREFPKADSAQRVSALEAEALFAAGDFLRAGTSFSRTAAAWTTDSALMAVARRNATVAFDSALAHAPKDAAIRDSLFVAMDRFIALAPDADARSATIVKGRRAAEGARWDVMAATFGAFEKRWPDDAFRPDASRLVGDALYKQGNYAGAQRQWQEAQSLAAKAGRKALADSVANTRFAAVSQAADSLSKGGSYAAADSLLSGIAGDIGDANLAADALRNAIEVRLYADSLARIKGDSAASLRERKAAITAIEALSAKYPAYKHTFTYATVRAKLLSDVGRPADAVEALQGVIAAQAAWPGRADAMVRVAVLLDSLGRKAESAAAFGAFIQQFPKDSRVATAQRLRVERLRAAGDSTAADADLARLCGKPPEGLAPLCAARAGAQAYRDGMAQWERYAGLKLEIKSKSQLNVAGVQKASAEKVAALRALNAQFTKAVASGAPEWVAAATFQSGLAQWYYGLFLRDAILPADLTDAQRAAASGGSKQQAQAYFDGAVKIWQALVDKAGAEGFDNAWVAKAKDALKGEGIPAREVSP